MDYDPHKWTLAVIDQMIANQVEENANLDYKGAGSLAKTEGCKKELRKDVSAFANSGGGVIIYGVLEDPSNKRLPGSKDPVSKDITKEWIESIIQGIKPRIDGIHIYPVRISGTDYIYVVDIPKSTTAHQACDFRYYKRFDFSSHMMEDYEIRDVMNRVKYPQIKLQFSIVKQDEGTHQKLVGISGRSEHILQVKAENHGSAVAEHLHVMLEIPFRLSNGFTGGDGFTRIFDWQLSNQKTDPAGHIYWEPILPGLGLLVGEKRIHMMEEDLTGVVIKWKLYCDNSPNQAGELVVQTVPIVDKTTPQPPSQVVLRPAN
jgi:hypothetical protein